MEVVRNIRCFSSSSVSPTSSIQWISPLHLKNTVHKPDLPAKTTGTITEVNRKLKFMSHEYAVNLIKREENPGRALEIFHKASNQKGFNHNNDTYATILHKLAKCKKFDCIDGILHQMAYETCKFHEGIFINLMKHFSTSCMHERVIDMFHAVQPIVRQKPSVKAFSTCLNLLIEANQIELARRFLINTQRKFHLMPNTCIFNILVKYHCRQDDLDSAIKVMKEMKSSTISYPNLITYSTLMDGLCKRGRLEEAMILFEEMVSKDQIVPDALTYNILISGICRGGKVDRAKSIIEFMRRNGCNPNVVNYTTLMNGFCKEGRLEDAKEVFKEMKTVGLQPDTVGYTTLIDSLCRANRLDEAIELLKEMNRTESSADVVTYNVILGALCRACRFDDALEMLDKLPYDGVFLNKASYRIVLNSLCKEDELDKVANLLSLMLVRGFIPHFGTSNELLVSLCVAGNGSDAGVLFKGLVDRGFIPEPSTWSALLDLFCRQRKLLLAFELIDELTVHPGI